ncbi:MAG: hypothetical protein ACLGIZ_10925 [Acidimicrobiia bacterium]
MHTMTGNTLYDADGHKVGEIVDVLGLYGGADDLGWLAVKLSWRSTRLVPDAGLEERDGAFRVPLTKDQIASAPKVPPHFEPAGDDREALLSHYDVRLAGL